MTRTDTAPSGVTVMEVGWERPVGNSSTLRNVIEGTNRVEQHGASLPGTFVLVQ